MNLSIESNHFVLWFWVLQPLEQHQARGKIQRYSVNYTLRLPDGEIMSRANITAYCNITLSETTQLVNVSAYNSVGATDPATLNLVQGNPHIWHSSIGLTSDRYSGVLICACICFYYLFIL